MHQAEDVEAGEFVLAAEEIEFDHEGATGDGGLQPFDEIHTGEHGAAGGQQIVHNQDSIGRAESIDVHVKCVGAVFEVVRKRLRFIRQLAGLSDGHERGIQRECERCGEDKPASLGSDDGGDAAISKVFGEEVGHLLKGR